jgi:hypothetical protein
MARWNLSTKGEAMKLSTAMMLGSTTCKMVPGDWNSCALGCAGNAVGIGQGVRREASGFIWMSDGRGRSQHIYDVWPWLNGEKMFWAALIWGKFDSKVCSGEITLEQLVDYVRSIEPSCGDCNKFECSCVKSEVVYESKAEVLI